MKHTKFSVDALANYYQDDNPEFALMKLNFLSSGENAHGYIISEEVLRRDAHTILGKFIVGEFSNSTNDFGGHTPTETILGYIPKDAEITFEDSDNGVFACVTGVISKLYAQNAYEVFKTYNNRSVSVEMTIGFENEEEKIISSINLVGCTILGLSVNPSCKLASCEIVKFSADKADEYYKQHQESTLVKFAKERKQKLGSDKMKVQKAEFAVNIGDLWCNVYDKLEKEHPDKDYGSIYRIEGVYEEEGNKFAIIKKKDNSQLYKLGLSLTEEGLEFAENIVEVDNVYIEKETIVKFEQPEDVEKFTEFVSADENVDAQKTVDNLKTQAELSDDEKNVIMEDEEKEEVDDEKQEETELAKCQAELEQVKAELELCKGKLSEVESKFETQSVEFAKLEEFKKVEMEKAKTFEVDKAMSEVKDYLKSAQFEELRNEGLACENEQLDAFLTKVKAVAFEAVAKGKKPVKERQGMWMTAFAEENKEKTKSSLWD